MIELETAIKVFPEPAAEVVEDMGGGAEGFFGIDDPGFFSQHFDQEFEGYRVSQGNGLTYE